MLVVTRSEQGVMGGSRTERLGDTFAYCHASSAAAQVLQAAESMYGRLQ